MTIDVGHVIVSNDEIMLYNFTKGKKQNIFNLIQSIDIFESIHNATVTANFYLAEGVELVDNFPIAGEEFIKISFQTPTRKTLTYEFFVDSVVNQKSSDDGTTKSYVLSCVTKDYLQNSYTVYSKRYKDKKYDEAIQEVIQVDWKAGTSLVTTEKTKGMFDYMVNGVRPLQVVDLICERAVSAEGNKSSVFFFYEDNEGYHFTTLEKLIKDRKSGAEGKMFHYDTAIRGNDFFSLVNVRNILSYEVLNQGSSAEKVKIGNHRMQIREFNIMTGEYYIKEEYINSSMHTEYEPTDSNEDLNSSAFNGFVSSLPAITKMAVKDGTRPDMKHNQNIHWKRPFQNKMNNLRVRLQVYGDTEIRVGDVIKLNIPEITGASAPKEEQQYYSGKYIITDLKHRLDKKKSTGFNHFLVLEVCKPNMLKAIP